jgi:hypothetical protein
MTTSFTSSETYSVADVETAFRRFRSDMLMIADSTQAITREKAGHYAHDTEYLAKRGFLSAIDVTLLSGGIEKKAARYTVNAGAGGDLECARPGGVLWPRVSDPWLRVVLSYTEAYTPAKKEAVRPHLKIGWVPSDANTSHASLAGGGARNYLSNSYALQRKDFG